MSCQHCKCECYWEEQEGGDEVSDFECPECGEELDDKGLCRTEECDYFECNPFDGGGPYIDEQKWERQQMGICG